MRDPIAPLIKALHAEGRLRVWSLVITVFGDLVQHRGGEMSTTRLGVLLERVGVERGALRTALSRLGRDGWVSSTRDGRASLYRLSAEGLERFAPATSRIYAAPLPAGVEIWALDVRLRENGLPELALRPADRVGDAADLSVTGHVTRISPAYRAHLLEPAHRRALSLLAHDLDCLSGVRIDAPLDAAAARMLLIHRWRRIVLRHADIHPDLMPPDAPLGDPRAEVAAAYRRLAPLAEAWLDSDADDLRAMPVAEAGFARRFAPRDEA